MSERDPVILLLNELDRPVDPSREFAEELLGRLLVELGEQDVLVTQPVVRRRRLRPAWHRRRLLAGAIALALVAAASAAVLLTRPSRASAFEVIERARQQFTQLPAFRAVIVVQSHRTRIAYKRFYRGPDAWRNEVSGAIDPTGQQRAGDYTVFDGKFLGVYRAATHTFYLTPGEEARAHNLDKATTHDIDPRFWNWPGPTGTTRLPADQFFKQSCKLLPDEVVAGREARHLTCNVGPVGKPGGPSQTVSIWLDARYGFILKLLGPNGDRVEMRSITINPSFAPGLFRVIAPRGSKLSWQSQGPVPPGLREKASRRVSATIPVGSHPGPLAAGAGSIWVVNSADGSLGRISPVFNSVTTNVAELRAYGLTFAAGSAWVVTNEGRLERIDPATNRLLGRPIEVGVRTPFRDLAFGDGTLWLVGGKARKVTNGRSFDTYGSLVRVDPASRRIVAQIPLPAELPSSAVIAVGEGAVWVASYRGFSQLLFRIDPRRNRVVKTLNLGHYGGGRIVTALGSVWVPVGLQDRPGYLIRLDPRSNRIVARIRVGEVPAGIAVGAGFLWATNSEDGTLSKIDPRTNRVVGAPLPIGDLPTGAVYAFHALWVADNQDNAVVRINQADLP